MHALRGQLRSELAGYGGAIISLEDVADMGDARPLQLSVQGPDMRGLDPLSAQIMDVIRSVPGAVDIDRSLDRDNPEIRVRIDRKLASDLGINLESLAMTMRTLLNGEVATQYEDEDGDAYDVRVRLAEQQRRSVDALRDIDLLSSKKNSAGGDLLIPIGQVASFSRASSSSQIRHFDLMREVRIFANTAGRPMGNVENDMHDAMEAMKLPAGYSVLFTGESEEMNETFDYIYEALILAIVFIYLILASQFGSFTHPLAIMLSLPLSLIGVAGLLVFTGDTLNIMSMIGLILLMGLVTKNAILLIDYTKRLRLEGKDRTAALGRSRADTVPADRHDDNGDDIRDAPAGIRNRRGIGASRANGAGRDRRADHLHDPDFDCGPRGLCAPGRSGAQAVQKKGRVARLFLPALSHVSGREETAQNASSGLPSFSSVTFPGASRCRSRLRAVKSQRLSARAVYTSQGEALAMGTTNKRL